MKKLTELKNIYFVGIKGVAMTSLALCADDIGMKVDGSDTNEIFVTDEVLYERKINYNVGFNKKNINKNIDLVVTTGAHGGLGNPEVLEAKKSLIDVITQGEALAYFAQDKKTIGVCGVGGKTTSSSMLCHIFSEAKKSPSYAIGVGKIYPLGYAGKYSESGNYFICEADEYVSSPGIDQTPKFLYLNPNFLIVTNIVHDHPDIYKNVGEVKKSFRDLFNKVPKDGIIVAYGDDKNISDTLKGLEKKVFTYGYNKNCDFVIENVVLSDNKQIGLVKTKDNERFRLTLTIPGRYNILNALASYIVSVNCGIPKSVILGSLESFKGTRRRFEKIGVTKNNVLVYDDYAHHPKEIRSLLSSAREWFGKKRIIAVFQPHTYSRTKILFEDFSRSFNDADCVCVMDIYASARENIDKSVSSKKLAQSIGKFKKPVFYTGGHDETIKWIEKNTKKEDILLTIGAGDIFHLHKKLVPKK